MNIVEVGYERENTSQSKDASLGSRNERVQRYYVDTMEGNEDSFEHRYKTIHLED